MRRQRDTYARSVAKSSRQLGLRQGRRWCAGPPMPAALVAAMRTLPGAAAVLPAGPPPMPPPASPPPTAAGGGRDLGFGGAPREQVALAARVFEVRSPRRLGGPKGARQGHLEEDKSEIKRRKKDSSSSDSSRSWSESSSSEKDASIKHVQWTGDGKSHKT